MMFRSESAMVRWADRFERLSESVCVCMCVCLGGL
jgi:hypothetical protein